MLLFVRDTHLVADIIDSLAVNVDTTLLNNPFGLAARREDLQLHQNIKKGALIAEITGRTCYRVLPGFGHNRGPDHVDLQVRRRFLVLMDPVELFRGLLGFFPAPEILDNGFGQARLEVSRVDFRFFCLPLPGRDLRRRHVSQELIVPVHQRVTDGHDLAEDFLGRLSDADIVVQRLAHLLNAVEPLQERHRHDDLRFLLKLPLDVAADQQVEFLVCSPELHVGPQFHRVIRLHQRVEDFVD